MCRQKTGCRNYKNKKMKGNCNMTEFNKKEKYNIYVKPETMEKAEELYKQTGFRSRSEFIERAIRFYSGFVTAENYRDYFPEIVVTTLQGMLDCFENRMARMLFKNAVETSMLLHVVAADTNIDEGSLTRLRGKCIRDVKSSQGMITFDEALKYQRGG